MVKNPPLSALNREYWTASRILRQLCYTTSHISWNVTWACHGGVRLKISQNALCRPSISLRPHNGATKKRCTIDMYTEVISLPLLSFSLSVCISRLSLPALRFLGLLGCFGRCDCLVSHPCESRLKKIRLDHWRMSCPSAERGLLEQCQCLFLSDLYQSHLGWDRFNYFALCCQLMLFQNLG